MLQPRLILFPQQHIDNTTDFISLLTEAQLISGKFDFKQHIHYLVGQQFFQHIMFLGCSPFIQTELPEDVNDMNFCHIEITSSQSETQFFHAQQMRPPRCPHCKNQISHWRIIIKQWQQDKSCDSYTCPECQQIVNITELNWRNKAGFGREMISIWGVFEGEAIPNDTFLSQLKQWTGVNWQYCHATGDHY
ncbi:hypothetical protein [Candidatus Albibeggiatoa sp. nov. BB20]|uniref:hypothetical protein n=1 Tax=Candidatus Albibeggiatoa sp. nov. BB20 TaxID=3162723 RepID=UPI003365AE74